MLCRLLCLGLVATALAACGSSVTGNSAFVSVNGTGETAQSLPKATEWCAKYGKVPRISGRDSYAVHYDCVRAT